MVLLGAVGVALVIELLAPSWRASAEKWFLERPFGCGLIAMGLLWLLDLAITGEHPWKLVEGEDGRASTSKMQLWLWTMVAIFAYVTITVARIHATAHQPFVPIADFPAGLLLAMGFSSATAVAAKGITSSYVASGQIAKPSAPGGQSVADLVTHDDGTPDLVKFQMLAWTFVAVGVFLVSLYEHIYGRTPAHSRPPRLKISTPSAFGIIGHLARDAT